MGTSWEPFAGRWFGIFNVEGDDPSPLALHPTQALADDDVARRRALPEEHDDHMTERHQVFPCDMAGVWWNSYDPMPSGGPLTVAMVAAIHEGSE